MGTSNGVAFDRVCRAVGLPVPLAEFQFAIHLGRGWRFDWAWPEHRIALEVEGGLWIQGRHQRAAGFREDMVKYNAAALEGWRVFRCEPATLNSDSTITMLRAAFQSSAKRA